jgi:hypothetical protein
MKWRTEHEKKSGDHNLNIVGVPKHPPPTVLAHPCANSIGEPMRPAQLQIEHRTQKKYKMLGKAVGSFDAPHLFSYQSRTRLY